MKEKDISPIWIAAGLPLVLLGAYLTAWVTDLMEQTRACETAARRIFESGACGKSLSSQNS